MTSEEFWKAYIEKPSLEIFDLTYDFFSKDLPADFTEDYDVGEVILETTGHHATAKEFEKVLLFTKLIHDRHPLLYGEYFQYFDDFLIDYYCFHNDTVNVVKSFSNFSKNPSHDYDKLLTVYNKLLFYQQNELVYQIHSAFFENASKSDNQIYGASEGLAMQQFYLNLERFYLESLNTHNFDRDGFKKSVKPFAFRLEEKTLTAIKKGLIGSGQTGGVIATAFLHDRKYPILTMRSLFLKAMVAKDFHFMLSGFLWDGMLQFWEDASTDINQTTDDYFSVNNRTFEKYLVRRSGDFFTDTKSEMIAVLWGSVYVYDFLRAIGVISLATFDRFKETSKVLKGTVIAFNTSTLWNSDFVHRWKKPDSITEVEFTEEAKIFQKSYSMKPLTFALLKSEISEELQNIGELSTYILEVEKKNTSKTSQKVSSGYGNINSLAGDDSNDDDTYQTYDASAVVKVGRNDPCPCGSGKKYKKCCMVQ